MHFRRALALIILVLGVAACGDDSDGGAAGGDFSVANAIGQLPASVDEEGLIVSLGDLAAATEAVDLDRPSSADDLVEWSIALSATRHGAVFVPMADVFGLQRSALLDEVDDELGWDITDVDWFVEAALPPNRLAVVAGGFSDEVFDEADVVELEGGLVSAGEGEDYHTDLQATTAARPLGSPLRMAVRDGLIAAGQATQPVRQWSDGDGDTLTDDERWAALAEALDASSSITAIVHRPSDSSGPGRSEGPGLTARYELVGIGWSFVDGESRVRIAYVFEDEDTAEAQAALLEEIFTDGESLVSRQPLSELVTLSSTGSDGFVAFADLAPTADGGVQMPFQMLMSRDLPFAQ